MLILPIRFYYYTQNFFYLILNKTMNLRNLFQLQVKVVITVYHFVYYPTLK